VRTARQRARLQASNASPRSRALPHHPVPVANQRLAQGGLRPARLHAEIAVRRSPPLAAWPPSPPRGPSPRSCAVMTRGALRTVRAPASHARATCASTADVAPSWTARSSARAVLDTAEPCAEILPERCSTVGRGVRGRTWPHASHRSDRAGPVAINSTGDVVAADPILVRARP
jgi:hypothetical protein